MTPFSGVDPFSPNAQPTGYGVWSPMQVVEDGDQRNAGNISAADKSAQNEIQFIGWRIIDIVSGGTYLFTAPINTKNVWGFTGTGNSVTGTWFFAGTASVVNGSDFYFGDPGGLLGVGHGVVLAGSDITAKAGAAGGAILADGTGGTSPGTFPVIAAKNGGIIASDASSPSNLAGPVNLLGPTTQTGTYTKSGAGAYTRIRTHTISPAGGTATVSHPENYDVIQIDPTNTLDGTVVLDAAAEDGIVIRVSMSALATAGPGGEITLKDAASNYLALMNPGGNTIALNAADPPCAFVDLLSKGTSYYVIGFNVAQHA